MFTLGKSANPSCIQDVWQLIIIAIIYWILIGFKLMYKVLHIYYLIHPSQEPFKEGRNSLICKSENSVMLESSRIRIWS